MGKKDRERVLTEAQWKWFKSRGIWIQCRVCFHDLLPGDRYHYQQSSRKYRHWKCALMVGVV